MVEIRAPVKVEQFGDRVREVRWMIRQRMLEMEMPGKMKTRDLRMLSTRTCMETGNDMVW